MGNRRSNAKTFGLMAAALAVTGAVVWILRRTWTDHDVSDPGITQPDSQPPPQAETEIPERRATLHAA